MQRTQRPLGPVCLAGVVVLAAVLSAGCGSDDADDNGASAESKPTRSTDYLGVLMGAREKGHSTKCKANLHALGSALHAYAASNEMKLPTSLDDLVKAGVLPDASVLGCPSSDGKPYL